MKISKRSVFAMTFLLLFSLFSILPSQASAAEEVIVFAAASMTESMNHIAELYKKAAPDVKIIYNFDSSGTLKTQIEQGADCDIFLSAGQRQMNELDIKSEANSKKLDFVMEGTRFNIVANQVVLIVPKGVNPKGINDFKDAATEKVKLIALGNSDVPVGQYSEEIYKSLGLWDQLNKESKISFASNVKEVLSQVAAGAVDCGAVYGTDAATSKAVDVVAKAPEGSHRPIVYPAAIMKNASDLDAARAFVEFLKGSEASAAFERVGFAIPAK